METYEFVGIIVTVIISVLGLVWRFETRISGVENRLENRISDVENRLGERLSDVENRLSEPALVGCREPVGRAHIPHRGLA